jgi:hypothetical protein
VPRRPVAIFALLAALAGIFLFLAWFAVFDGGGIRRGDLAYAVFIPSEVRRLPALAACSEPLYASTTNDSLEAEVIRMEFQSHSDAAELVAAYKREIASWTCDRLAPAVIGSSVLFRCSKPDVEVTLVVADRGEDANCRRVMLEFRFAPLSK